MPHHLVCVEKFTLPYLTCTCACACSMHTCACAFFRGQRTTIAPEHSSLPNAAKRYPSRTSRERTATYRSPYYCSTPQDRPRKRFGISAPPQSRRRAATRAASRQTWAGLASACGPTGRGRRPSDGQRHSCLSSACLPSRAAAAPARDRRVGCCNRRSGGPIHSHAGSETPLILLSLSGRGVADHAVLGRPRPTVVHPPAEERQLERQP